MYLVNEKEFSPHITVKRWQRYEYEDLVQELERVESEPLEFLISSVLFLNQN